MFSFWPAHKNFEKLLDKSINLCYILTVSKRRKTLNQKGNVMKVVKIFNESCPFNPCGQGGIEFSDGSVLVDLHEQDCCENVYADFSNLDSDIMSYTFKGTIQIREAKEGFKFGDGRRWFFVPCYNEQNGYYNDALSIAYGSVVKKIARYSKGKPIYDYKFVARTTLEGCPVEDNIY